MEYPTKHIGIIKLLDERQTVADFDRVLDLRGEVCPYTFVKARLALEEMAENQILWVLVDYPPAVENVPKSLAIMGYPTIAVQEVEIEPPSDSESVLELPSRLEPAWRSLHSAPPPDLSPQAKVWCIVIANRSMGGEHSKGWIRK